MWFAPFSMATGMKVVVLFALAGLCAAYKLQDGGAPTFAKVYTVQGVLQLPYAEIKEPFTAYFDSGNKKSRIDYYDSTVVTIQRPDKYKSGSSYKLAPMSMNGKNSHGCFQSNGTVNATVTTQSILPDLTGFKKIRSEMQNGVMCDVWMMTTVNGHKTSIYTMWLKQKGNAPVRYTMEGYDSLLGSHFDRYYLDYFNYTANKGINQSVFEPKMKCTGFPGPGSDYHLMNPMREFIHGDDSHTVTQFQEFKDKHKKSYGTKEEEAQRLHTFRQNARFIHSTNRAGLSYRVAINHLTDRTDGEIKLMRGYRYSHTDHGGLPFDASKYNVKDIPDTMDWRLYGAVTQVKDQAVCGSCWSFGTTGTIEGANFLKTGNLIRLSQQELMDCSWGQGNNACDGGEDFRSYQYIMKNGGLTSEEQYGPYRGSDGVCHSKNVKAVVQLSGYVNVTPYDENALKIAIAQKGPISVSIDASHKSLSFYSNGVYYEPSCGSDPDSLDHSVLAVGYGVMNGQAYWLIKNSWSTYWGNDGFVLMSQKNNNCGVATSPTFVMIK